MVTMTRAHESRYETRSFVGGAGTLLHAHVPVDKSLACQQNLAALPIAVIVLDPASNEHSALLPLCLTSKWRYLGSNLE